MIYKSNWVLNVKGKVTKLSNASYKLKDVYPGNWGGIEQQMTAISKQEKKEQRRGCVSKETQDAWKKIYH